MNTNQKRLFHIAIAKRHATSHRPNKEPLIYSRYKREPFTLEPNITNKEFYKLLGKNTISKGYIKSQGYPEILNLDKLIKAIRLTANKTNLSKKDLFKYLINDEPTLKWQDLYTFELKQGTTIEKDFEVNYKNS
jgi:hypothetical protein